MFLHKFKKLTVAILPPAVFNIGQDFLYKLRGQNIRNFQRGIIPLSINSEINKIDPDIVNFNWVQHIIFQLKKLFQLKKTIAIHYLINHFIIIFTTEKIQREYYEKIILIKMIFRSKVNINSELIPNSKF